MTHLEVKGHTVKIIGDVHLGKRFLNGVPLARQGEREEMVFIQFEEELNDVEGCVACIQTADLFNTFNVPNHVLLRTAQAIISAAQEHPTVCYIFNRGNHDASRDTALISSYHILRRLIEAVKLNNVHVFELPSIIGFGGLSFGVAPWHPFKTLEEQLETFQSSQPGWFPLSLITTHVDMDGSFPHKKLAELTDLVVNGHEHKPATHHFPNLTVIGSGSMQPYAFGESLEEGEERQPQYITMVVEQATGISAELRDAVVRLRLRPGEEVPTELEPLQLVLQRIKEDGSEEDGVEFEAFDMNGLFEDAMQEAGVEGDVLNEVRYDYTKMRD